MMIESRGTVTETMTTTGVANAIVPDHLIEILIRVREDVLLKSADCVDRVAIVHIMIGIFTSSSFHN